MNCCDPTIVPFTGEETKSIPYSAQMLADYGQQPNVQVYFKDTGTGEFVLSDDMNRVDFDGSVIDVDLGGLGTGVIKIF